MKTKRHKKASSKKQADQLVAIFVLHKIGWSSRRIARLKLPSSHHTITNYLAESCKRIKSDELPILAKDERKTRITYKGTDKDLSYINGKINNNPCGGGRRAKKYSCDDEEEYQ